MIIDGRKISKEILTRIKSEVAELPHTPVFCDILVGSDPASVQYVRMKAKTAESVGMKFRSAEFPEAITTEALIEEIENLNRVPHMCGIIMQLPLPDYIDRQKVLDAIDPRLDVDYLGTIQSQKFYSSNTMTGFPTALACMKALESVFSNLSGKNIAVVGQGRLVGKPVAHLLESKGYSVAKIDSATEHKEALIKNADIVISAVGMGKFITGENIKTGAIVIDAGTSEDNGAIVGDVDLASVEPVASYVSPTPGGVGPITVAMLLSNVLMNAKEMYGH